MKVWSYQLAITTTSNQSSEELGKILGPNIWYNAPVYTICKVKAETSIFKEII